MAPDVIEPTAAPTSRSSGAWRGLVLAVLLGATATIPYALHAEAEFKSDDFVLIARGVETGLLDGLWRNLSRPFADTWAIEFYRPLFTYSFVVDGHLFGDDPVPYRIENLVWHGLAIAAGYLVLRRLLGARTAVLATILFAASPWSVNGVAWISGRCAVVSTLLLFIAILLYWRHVDRDRRGPPWGAFLFGLLAGFYRETAFILPFFVFLVDVLEGRRTLARLRDWCFLSVPLLIYAAASTAVLGTFFLKGGYARLTALRGPAPVNPTALGDASELGLAVLNLVAPGAGTTMLDFGPLRWASIGLVAALLGIALVGGAWKRGATWVFLLFAVVYAAPLLLVDRQVLAGSSQRWYGVTWAIAGLFAACAGRSRWPSLATALVLGLTALGFFRLHQNLTGYDESARFSRTLRETIAAQPEDLVFVYGLKPYDGPSPFFEIGLGATQLPPFGDGTKSVYPIFEAHRFAPDPEAQNPVAAWLHLTGRPCAALWADVGKRAIDRIPPERLQAAAAQVAALPRLLVLAPSARVSRDVRELELVARADGLERIDVYLACPLTEARFQRYRGLTYTTAAFRPDGTFTDRLDVALEFATLLDGAAKGRAWLWLVGYASADPGALPAKVSEFFELHVTREQASPHR